MLAQKVNRICINTGNLISCKEFNKRATQTPTEEVLESIRCTLHSWLEGSKIDSDGNETLQCVNSNYAVKVNKDDRVNLKLTVKVFLQSFSPESLKEAINEVMQQLDVSFIDSIILTLSASSLAPLTLDKIQPLWEMLEALAVDEKVVTIGVSDLDAQQLSELYSWAQVKPSVNQVSLESCCVMPPEMTAFAKENDIQLLTHNDPKDLLPQHALESVLEPVMNEASEWRTAWLLRYSVIVKCRGIIQNKGYVIFAVKNPSMAANGPC